MTCKGITVAEIKMKKHLHRRISIASCWASSRIALLDSIESYEDSYAITQEFREWIVCIENKMSKFDSSVLKVPNSFTSIQNESKEQDELLEL